MRSAGYEEYRIRGVLSTRSAGYEEWRGGQVTRASASSSAAARTGSCVLAAGAVGRTEASATRRPATPWTAPCPSTTARGSPAGPVAQVPRAVRAVGAGSPDQHPVDVQLPGGLLGREGRVQFPGGGEGDEDAGLVGQVGADARQVHLAPDAVLLQVRGRSDAAAHQYGGGAEGSAGQHVHVGRQRHLSSAKDYAHAVRPARPYVEAVHQGVAEDRQVRPGPSRRGQPHAFHGPEPVRFEHRGRPPFAARPRPLGVVGVRTPGVPGAVTHEEPPRIRARHVPVARRTGTHLVASAHPCRPAFLACLTRGTGAAAKSAGA
ncbi:hypothetical protein OEIGOIKO_08077 [Streptomyces chrestomyceticus JCM 4735]|uniref:Uncharacterized protein n=1 Tax=Streptomyces chrestomyceticus JCM 4735 TaxID=1306181 RepID=A0A7U9Q2T2_9ACTN|nr:hypothetical protein OEIGOIKO_08077 [Streptomyces chrestomyceticus JCM 4735]